MKYSVGQKVRYIGKTNSPAFVGILNPIPVWRFIQFILIMMILIQLNIE